MIVYKIAFLYYSIDGTKEIFCGTDKDFRVDFETTDINEVHRFRNKYWNDSGEFYIKEVETD